MTARTPLPPPDRAAAAALWADYAAAHPDWAAAGPDYVVHFFGDHVDLADELVELVESGRKRATAELVSQYLVDGEPLPRVGAHLISCDGSGRPRVILRTHRIRLAPYSAADEAFAHAEGEDDGTLESWLREHERYFRRVLATRGETFSPELELTFEEFTVVWPPHLADAGAGVGDRGGLQLPARHRVL
ncbi:ASCH domain-containing protein [Subtercola sp. YIM 133946]|uniref:ASCH domain-containing protein n=1 Tax=Subtercola sp. YIM 133946 TaxID=3118909 RepID=UPI002F92C339